MSRLKLLYLKLRYPDVCWIHRRFKSGGTYGGYCAECNQNASALADTALADRNEFLKRKYGIRHGLLR